MTSTETREIYRNLHSLRRRAKALADHQAAQITGFIADEIAEAHPHIAAALNPNRTYSRMHSAISGRAHYPAGRILELAERRKDKGFFGMGSDSLDSLRWQS